ncbi:dihydroorotate dehydrogenase (quinone), mitochondrial isoform X2 [Plodia interpunctella]|uniref:dihydroorotate dehydrogenase (quinone), mitochondrial isoform X2 n=1 Tax=Plodia interpunctella TaxID=58824 RepID=UPI002367D315|nr:dihydroorotate dehydrogenase (quinone), mitochondrial isoform X2 [Plodia interpunctella]
MSSKTQALKKIKSLCYLTLGGSVAYQFTYMKKDFNGYYQTFLQPASQFLTPELAHKVGVTAVKCGFFPREQYDDPHVLTTKFLDFELSNPLGIAAGFDKHGDAVVGLRNIGFSIVEIGSVTPEPQAGNPKPRVFRLPEDRAVINRYGFNSEGINLGKNKESNDAIQDYILGIKKFNDIADYFVINISSPNTPGLRSLQEREELEKLLTKINIERNSIQAKTKPPLLLKLAPDLTNDELKDVIAVITKKQSKVDGLIISNTTIDRSSLVNKEFSNEIGGLSGKPLTNKSTEMIKQVYTMTKGKIPIIGVGGVFTGQDAYEKILAGANAVQIYTSFIYEGPPIITRIKSDLAELLQRDGYKCVNEAIGKAVK